MSLRKGAETESGNRLLARLIPLWAVFLTPLLFWLPSYESFEMPKQLALKAAAAALAFLFAMRGFTASSSLAAPVLCLLLLSLLSSLASPLLGTALFGEYASYQGWLHWAALGFLLLALPRILENRRIEREFLVAAALSIVLTAGYALLQLFGLDFFAWEIRGPLLRTFSTSGNPLYLGFLLAAGLPVAFGLSLSARAVPIRLGWLSATALIFAGLLASGSRGALIGSLAGAAVSVFLARGKPRSPGLFWGQALIAFAAPLILCAVLLPAERNPFPLLASRFSSLVRGDDSRLEIWKGAARLIRRSPLVGSGLDSFATLHSQVQTPRLWDYVWHGSPEKAHNELVQLAATGGLLVTGAALWLLALLARLAFLRPREGGAAAGGLLALFLTSQIGFITCAPQIVAVLLAATLAGGSRRVNIGLPRTAAWATSSILLAGLVLNLHFAASEVALKRAVADGGKTIDRALRLKTPWAQRLFRAGDSLEHLYMGTALKTGMRPDQSASARMLVRIYEEARRVNPLYSNSESNLARMAARAGRTEEALAGYIRARELAPMDAYLALEQAQVLLSSGREEESVRILQNVSDLYPDFAEPKGLLGYVRLKNGDRNAAEILLKRSLDLNWRGNWSAADAAARNLAAIYHATGREDLAIRAIQRARSFEYSGAGL